MSEQTATNPQTGERIVLRNGQWVPLGQPAAPTQPAQPPMARGQDPIVRPAPRPAPITPVQAQNMQNDAERLEMARNAEARADAAATMGSVEQGKAASFLERAINSNDNFSRVESVGPRSIMGQVASDAFPMVSNALSETDRQLAAQAEREFIAAVLRYDSGAAIPPEEFVSNGMIYFPRPGDSPEVIAQKADARRVAINGLLNASGPGGQRVWERYQQSLAQQGGAGAVVPQGAASGAVPPATPPESRPPVPDMTLQDMYPQGAELGMDTIGRDDPFDEMEYLRREYGIEPEDERRLVGALNARTGDAQFGERDVLTIYESLGMTPPDEAGIAQIVGDVRQGATFGGIDTSAARAEYEGMLDSAIESRGGNPETMSASIGGGAVQGITVGLADEISGIGGALNSLMEFENPATGYRAERDVARREFSRAERANPTAFAVSNIGSSLVTGGARVVPAAMRSARPVAAAAREGAIFGGAFGFGQGEGAADSVIGAGVGALTGAAGGAVIQRGEQALAPVGRRISDAMRGQRVAQPDPAAVRGVVEAGERRGVPIMRANVDPNIRGERANVLQGERGATLRNVEQDNLAALETAVVRDLGGGNMPSKYEAGSAAQSGLAAARTATRNRAGALYNEVQQEVGSVGVDPTDALAVLDRNIAELSEAEAANADLIRYLNDVVRKDLTREGGLTVGALRAQRSGIGARLRARQLDATDLERRIGDVYSAAALDLENALSNNPQALSKLQEANRLWREQAQVGERIGRSLLGRGEGKEVNPEAAADALLGYARKDYDRLAMLWEQVPETGRAEIRALLASRLGRQQNGNFSAALLVRAIGKGDGAAVSPRAARLIFGKDGMVAMNDLRVIAQSMVDAAEATNRSNTGGIFRRAAGGFRTLVAGSMGFNMASPGMGVPFAAAAAIGDRVLQRLGEDRALRLLTNPDFTRWMRSLPETTNPKAIDNQFDRLRRISAGNAQFNNDVQEFQRALIGAANDNAGVAGNIAASEQEQQKP